MASNPRKRFTEAFKVQAVELLRSGKPVSELAEERCVSNDLLYRWKRETHVRSEGMRAVGGRSGADDLRALLRENDQLRMENDIVKKAAHFRQMIAWIHLDTGHGIRSICKVLGLPRSSYYHAATPTATELSDRDIAERIERILRHHRVAGVDVDLTKRWPPPLR